MQLFFILFGIDTVVLLQVVELAVETLKNVDLGIPAPDYADTSVPGKVVRIIQSSVDVVNKMVGRKF